MSVTINPRPRRTWPLSRLREAMNDDDGGCLACGEFTGGCEPDARKYECEHCGEFRVFGAEELILLGRYTDDEDDAACADDFDE
jgi:hypothetical protein